MEMIGKIRRMFYREHLSLHQIAKRTGLARNTIRKWIRTPDPVNAPEYERESQPGKLTPYHPALKQALIADSYRPKHNRRTAKALFQQIQAQGYTGSYCQVITPYRAQCKALRQALKKHEVSEALAIEVDTVDAFQGRQADIVFFSFVRNTGPATFYADDRRMNVAISRARDTVYLVGDIAYIKTKQLPVLKALVELPVLAEYS